MGGKGGVGKTTTAASLAIVVADQGRKCLVVSTDPAHSLSDIFEARIGDRETPLGTNLWGLEIDPTAEADRHIAIVKENMKKLVHPRMYSEVDRQIDLARLAPGTLEAALLERVADLMGDATNRFDVVIFDTAPTGHTIRLLSLPEVMAAWADGLLKHRDRAQRLSSALKRLGGTKPKRDDLSLLEDAEDRPEDRPGAAIDEILLTRRRKFHRARHLLLDGGLTAFLLVLNPEKLPILETKRTLTLLKQFKVPVAAMIVNRMLPEEPQGEFLQARRLQENKYREEIDREFATLPRIYLPLLPHDVHGIETLRHIGQLLAQQAAGASPQPAARGPKDTHR